MKFTNETAWVARNGEELSGTLELVAVNVTRVVQKWKDEQPIETIILEPGQKFPDLEKLNDAVPKSEWREGPDGKLRGPWQAQYLVYLLNAETVDRYTYVTATTGGGIAVRDLVDRTRWMRKFRGANVYAVVTLSDTFMPDSVRRAAAAAIPCQALGSPQRRRHDGAGDGAADVGGATGRRISDAEGRNVGRHSVLTNDRRLMPRGRGAVSGDD